MGTQNFCSPLVITKSDPSLFTYSQGHDYAYLLFYVDDIILTTSSKRLRERLISQLKTEFSKSDLGPLGYFSGIVITIILSSMLLSQQKYAQKILKRAGMSNCKPAATPVDSGH